MISLTQQVGGNHYKEMGMQPFEFSLQNGWDAAAHSVLKYVARHKAKGGLQDLEKAIHICDIRADLLPAGGPKHHGYECNYLGRSYRLTPSSTAPPVITMLTFCGKNNILSHMPEFDALCELDDWVALGHMCREYHQAYANRMKTKIDRIIKTHY